MVATNLTKYNGKWYRAGETLPDIADEPIIKEEAIETLVEEPKEEKTYTRSAISTMNVKNLRRVASENGIENPYDYVGSELKAMLIEKLGL